MNKHELKELIDSAFKGTIKPSILCATSDEYSDYEGNVVAEYFEKRPYTDITLEDFKKNYPGDYSAAIFFMNAQAAAYFLPSFMKICIDNYYEADTLPLSLLTALSGGRTQEERQWSEQLAEHLTEIQKHAVREYIEYMSARYPEDCFDINMHSIMQMYMGT